MTWRDQKGRMRLDVELRHAPNYHFAVWVKKHSLVAGFYWEYVPMSPLRIPKGLTKQELKHLQRVCAELAAMQLGYDYRLRSTR